MAKDHYIPAAFIGRFSADKEGPLRQRKVAVLRQTGEAHLQQAQSIGFANNFYTIPDTPDRSIDPLWGKIEQPLPQALNELEKEEWVSTSMWLRTLVPFVASVFVRGREFNERYRNRPAADALIHVAGKDALTPGTLNMSRVMELQRLLPNIMYCTWVITHFPSAYSCISNDLGFFPSADGLTGENVMAIPLSSSTILSLLPSKNDKEIARWRNGE